MSAIVRALQADITQLPVGAIVNAVAHATGKRLRELLRECRRLAGCKTGEAKLTPGYRLPAQHIIHTVGPVWHGGSRGEPELLAACYRSAIQLAAAHGILTLAFPSISTGVYGYPIELAAQVAVTTVRAALHKYSAIQEVIFCCFSAQDLQVYQAVLAESPP